MQLIESEGLKSKYKVIDELKHKRTDKETMCLSGNQPKWLLKYLKRKDYDPDEELKLKIRSIFEQRDVTIGYRRIKVELYRQYRLCDS